MEALLWILFAALCGAFAFKDSKPSHTKPKQDNQQNNQDDDYDDFGDALTFYCAADILSDGELDGNFSDEY